MKSNSKDIELLAPGGSYAAITAAIKAGANAIYFGVAPLNMRKNCSYNFTIEDIGKIASICHKSNIKSYLALNTLLYNTDITIMHDLCDEAKKSKIDAIIACDMAAIQYANKIDLSVHISTQANVSNIEALKFYSNYADTIVLARELGIEDIRDISRKIITENIRGPSGKHIKIELFIHGALCVAISGKCYMSLAQYNASANRGECLQACRRKYRVIEEETDKELLIDNKYVMSPKDLCTIDFLDTLIASGCNIFKIEGRGRSADYVFQVVKAYREAIDNIYSYSYTPKKIKAWIDDLKKVYNRGFWHRGYYLGKKLSEWSKTHGSVAQKTKTYVGRVTNYFTQAKIVEAILEAGDLEKGNEIVIIGDTTGVVKNKITNLRVMDKDQAIASKKQIITFPLLDKVRKNDKIYVIKDKNAEFKINYAQATNR
jgi:U32 family peptidase